MLFTTWLFGQTDEQNDVGDIARLCKKDVNNGCAPRIAHIKGWVDHFTDHHPTKISQIVPLLSTAYKEYYSSSAFDKPELE
jgi:hypothetical protein